MKRVSKGLLVPAVISLALLIPFSFPLAYEVIQVPRGGNLRGVVQWKGGPIPARAVHHILKNPDFCGKTALDDALQVHPENGGIENVAVFLENITGGRAPRERYVNTIEKCRFHPRMTPVVRGKFLGFRHNDFILHSLHGFSMENNATLFNIGLPIHRWQQVVGLTIRPSGLFRLQCDIHAHMNGVILSLEHDYFDVTDADGQFKIGGVPPGRYRVVAVQAGYEIKGWEGEKERSRPVYEAPHRLVKEVEIREGEETRVDYEFGGEKQPF